MLRRVVGVTLTVGRVIYSGAAMTQSNAAVKAVEGSASIEIAKHTLLSCSLILAVGIAIGPHAFGLIDIPANSVLNQIILVFGATFFLTAARAYHSAIHYRRFTGAGGEN